MRRRARTISSPAMSIREIDAAVAHVAPERRAKMLGQVTDLFVMHAPHFSDTEIELFDDVIGRLVVEIELEAKVLLSEKLATIPNAPPKIIRTLAFDDEADVACPVLTHSERLGEASLVENARIKGQKHLLAISRRRALGEPVTDILVGRGDRAVAISVAGNAGARLSENGFMVLIRRSAEDDVLAERLGERREIPAHLFLKLLSVASEKVRAKLRASHPHAGAEIDRVVAEVTDRMRSPIVAAQRDYSAILQELGSRFIARKLGEADLVRFLLAERFDEVVVTLALMARIHVSVVDRAMHGDRSDVVIIIARAIGLKWPTTKLVLQLWAQPRPLTAAEVGQNLASFEQLTQATAAQLIRFHDAASPRSKQPD